jgi:hypothetical protein
MSRASCVHLVLDLKYQPNADNISHRIPIHVQAGRTPAVTCHLRWMLYQLCPSFHLPCSVVLAPPPVSAVGAVRITGMLIIVPDSSLQRVPYSSVVWCSITVCSVAKPRGPSRVFRAAVSCRGWCMPSQWLLAVPATPTSTAGRPSVAGGGAPQQCQQQQQQQMRCPHILTLSVLVGSFSGGAAGNGVSSSGS